MGFMSGSNKLNFNKESKQIDFIPKSQLQNNDFTNSKKFQKKQKGHKDSNT